MFCDTPKWVTTFFLTLFWNSFISRSDGTWTGTYVSESAGLSISVDADGMPEILDVTPILGGIAYEGVDDVIEDDFFEQVNYKGAFGSDNWLEGWSGIMESVTMLNTEESDEHIISDQISLLGNYPNPFNPSTEIAFELGKSYGIVGLKVFNLMGQTVFNLVIVTMSKMLKNLKLLGGSVSNFLEWIKHGGGYVFEMSANSF